MAGDLKVGDTAPPLELVGSDGETYRLADFKGKQAVLIAWFPKAFTGGWTAECKSLRASGENLRKFHVAHFAASCDSVETNTKFAKSLELDYPILSDPDRKVALAYGLVANAQGMPKRWTFFIGPDGTILHIDKKVTPNTHGADCAAKLAELGVAAFKQ